jgi:hypothetical protein
VFCVSPRYQQTWPDARTEFCPDYRKLLAQVQFVAQLGHRGLPLADVIRRRR